MAAEQRRKRDVECPYYHYEYPKYIECEGIIRGTLMKNYFRSEKKKGEHAYDFCAGNYRGCPLYQLLEEEHERRYQEGSLWEND